MIPLSPASAHSPPAPASLARLFSAPHRLAFFCGATLMVASALWWLILLGLGLAGVSPPWAMPSGVAHGVLMVFGFMPCFVAGFLFTAGPRWLGLAEVPARVLQWPLALQGGGCLLLMVGAHAWAGLAALGMALMAGCGAVLLARFYSLLRASRVPDRWHARLVLAACAAGVVALALAAAAVARGAPALARAAAWLGLWLYLVPLFTVVLHRMLPFFTGSAVPGRLPWRPMPLLAAMLAGTVAAGLGGLVEFVIWPVPTLWYALLAAFEAALALALGALSWRWGLRASLRVPLLAMLHIGFFWLPVSLALAAAGHACAAAGLGTPGLAPLHALSMGYLGVTLFAMISRVSLGHSGRPLVPDAALKGAWALANLAVLTRVIVALWPGLPPVVLVLAALLWAMAAGLWLLRCGPWLLQPRADGRPG